MAMLVNQKTSPLKTTEETDRFGNTYWAVTWGPGITQTAICNTEAERDAAIATRSQAVTQIEPLIKFG